MLIIPVSQNGILYWEKQTHFVKTCLLSLNEHCKSVVEEMCCLLSVGVFVHLLVSLQSLCLSSTEENSRILCCQAADLQVTSAAGHVFSHHVTTFKRASVASRVGTCIRPPDPLQSALCSLSYPVNIVVCHIKPWYYTWHLHCLSRSFYFRLRLIQSFTPDTWTKIEIQPTNM